MGPFSIVKEGSMLYDLYGVVNHSGTLSFGHYTAKCFNEPENKWYTYNDSMVSQIKTLFSDLKDDIVTPSAYVLFYKQRGFSAKIKDDFDKIVLKSTGSADHLLIKPEDKKQEESDTKPDSEMVTPPKPNVLNLAENANHDDMQ